VTRNAEEFLEGAMALPPRERWRLGMRLLQSLEVVDPKSPGATVESSNKPPE
jgi:hypothetical protein